MRLADTPKLAPGCRLHPTADILLIPEGTLDLSGPARDILLLVDGRRTVGALIAELATQFEAAPVEIEQDVLSLLTRMQERGALKS